MFLEHRRLRLNFLVPMVHEGDIFWERDEPRAFLLRRAYQIAGCADILRHILAAARLYAGNPQFALAHFKPSMPSNLPERSRSTNSSEPPIGVSPMKICGTV